jgi:hypothetical protein
MKDRFCTIFIELKLKELLLKRGMDLGKINAIEFWEIIKEISKVKFETRRKIEFISDKYIFECSLSEKDSLYYVMLTRMLNISWQEGCFFKTGFTEYFHFIFAYHPMDKYKNFKGQLYSQDFNSLTQFFDIIETKEIFKFHVYFNKPVNISYLIDNKLVTNF